MSLNKKDAIPSEMKKLRLEKNNCVGLGMMPKKNGAETQICTGDARIFSPALYSLSYLGMDKRTKNSTLFY